MMIEWSGCLILMLINWLVLFLKLGKKPIWFICFILFVIYVVILVLVILSDQCLYVVILESGILEAHLGRVFLCMTQ